jgi:RNA polymerase sigma-70 factor (ECF subfamily)
MTDEQRASGCLKGEPAAQKPLYKAYARKMMSICMRYASDREQA